MFGRGGMMGRGPYFEGVQKLAPIIIFVLFAIIAVALVRNFIDAKVHPKLEDNRPDPVKNFYKLNARGLVNVITKRSDK